MKHVFLYYLADGQSFVRIHKPAPFQVKKFCSLGYPSCPPRLPISCTPPILRPRWSDVYRDLQKDAGVKIESEPNVRHGTVDSGFGYQPDRLSGIQDRKLGRLVEITPRATFPTQSQGVAEPMPA